MIVGCYSLDLYCRNEGLPLHFGSDDVPGGFHIPSEFPHTFDAHKERGCREKARKVGWVFASRDATCPRCARAKVKTHDQ